MMFTKSIFNLFETFAFIIVTATSVYGQEDIHGTSNSVTVDVKAADSLPPVATMILHNEKILFAKTEFNRENVFHQELILFFDDNSAALNPDLPLNKSPLTLQKMEQLTDFLEKGWPVKSVTITGYASPDGPVLLNEWLSKERAAAGEKYIRKVIGEVESHDKSMTVKKRSHDDIPYDLHGSGEDWDGLVKSLEAYNIKERDTLEAIIRTQQDANKREQEIMKMTAVYPEVKDKILPALRRVDITVYCREPERSDGEILALAVAHPEELTYHELMHAATLTIDTATRLKLYENATFRFPNEWEAFNNAACCYLEEGRTAEAIVYLNNALNLFPGNGTTLNNFAAASLKNNNPEKAATYLSLAEKEGIDESYNKGLLALERKQYPAAVASFRGVTCDYNAALAAFMSGDVMHAAALVSCAPAGPEAYYLRAVLAAGRGDAPSLFENLTKACTLQPALKETARRDRSFKAYAGTPEFIKITGSGSGGS
jgi:hypothetical protein